MTDDTRPDLGALTRAASDIISVRRVFGEPYEHGGTLVVPVGKVMGWHGVAGATGDARLGIRGGRRHGDGHGHGDPALPGPAPDDPAAGPGRAAHVAATDGDEAVTGAPAVDADHGGPHAHGAGHGTGRGPWPVAPRGPVPRPLWPFGAGRPGGRSGGAADAGGYATRVKPLGVFVIDDDGAQWQPALDLNRIILGGQVVGAVAAVAVAWALRRRRR